MITRLFFFVNVRNTLAMVGVREEIEVLTKNLFLLYSKKEVDSIAGEQIGL